jgi:hypothetical protein
MRAPAVCPHCGRPDDPGAEFDRTLRLLKQHVRSERRPEGRFKPGGRRQRWTFLEAMTLVEKTMRGMGVKMESEAQGKGVKDLRDEAPSESSRRKPGPMNADAGGDPRINPKVSPRR